MQGAFHHHGVFSMVAEHNHGVVGGRLRRQQGQPTAKVAQVERILHGIEPKGIIWQGAIGQPGQEGMRQNAAINLRNALPECLGKGGHGVAPIGDCVGKGPLRSCLAPSFRDGVGGGPLRPFLVQRWLLRRCLSHVW
jgi:hypothetical protein